MNGPHDIGGRHGFGAIGVEDDTPYHADWEKRAMALTLAAGPAGGWSIDESRFARENRAPAQYYALGYFQLWLAALERLLLEKGLVTARELAEARAMDDTAPPRRRLSAADVPAVLARGAPVDREAGESRPAFAPGDHVRTRNLHPAGHIRLPAYARDKVGRIEAVQGHHVFADASAAGDHDVAHWLYTVVFEAETLWGPNAETPRDTISFDAWEPYLERA